MEARIKHQFIDFSFSHPDTLVSLLLFRSLFLTLWFSHGKKRGLAMVFAGVPSVAMRDEISTAFCDANNFPHGLLCRCVKLDRFQSVLKTGKKRTNPKTRINYSTINPTALFSVVFVVLKNTIIEEAYPGLNLHGHFFPLFLTATLIRPHVPPSRLPNDTLYD